MKNKKIIGIIIAVLVVLLIASIGIIILLNPTDNDIPANNIVSDENIVSNNETSGESVNPNIKPVHISINQKYTDKLIIDGESAIASLEDVKDIFGIKNAE